MSRAAPFVLFVPSYGGGGSGEFVRAVVLAQSFAARWPALRIEFLLPGGPGTRQDAPFPRICHDGPPDAKGAFDDHWLERLRPDIALFDSACRTATLRLCRRLGIASVYVSDREGPCRKAFRADWLWLLDEHWHQRELLTAAAFTPVQRVLAPLSRTRRIVFDTYLAPPTAAPLDALGPAVLEQIDRPFVLLAPGGGGYRVQGRPIGQIYAEAAERIVTATGIACITLVGALHPGAVRGALQLREVGPGAFVALMRKARVVACGGGHSLNQALACGAAVVAAPLGGADQPGRIGAYAAAGLVTASAPTVDGLVERVGSLLAGPRRDEQLRRVARLAPVDGVPLMGEAFGRRLDRLAA